MCAQNSFIIVTFFPASSSSFFLFPLFHNGASFLGVRIDEVDVVEEEWVGKRDAYDDGHSCELVFIHFLPIIIDACAFIQQKKV
jgi:hypothetical protein